MFKVGDKVNVLYSSGGYEYGVEVLAIGRSANGKYLYNLKARLGDLPPWVSEDFVFVNVSAGESTDSFNNWKLR